MVSIQSIDSQSNSFSQPLSVAVIGAGPVGLSLALLLAAKLPQAQITTYDARSVAQDIHEDPRTLALSLGSVELLQRLGAWQPEKAQLISTVHVSQQQPSLIAGDAKLCISAQEMGVPMLGAVAGYGDVLASLQKRWLEYVLKNPQQYHACFDSKVKDIRTLENGRVELDAHVLQAYDLVVVAQGGIFAQSMQGTQDVDKNGRMWMRDYQQNAWVGRVTLQQSMNGVAYERFTANGPVALLPLGEHEAALVWCQYALEDNVSTLSKEQRVVVLNALFPQEVGVITGVSELTCFALGLKAQKSQVQGRTVYIGNAAQMLHPVAGQGLNLGLRDVFALAEHLAGVGEGAEALDKALKRMAWSRLPDRFGMMGATEFLARSFTWDLPGLPEVRNVALEAVQRLGPLKHFLAKHMMYGWR